MFRPDHSGSTLSSLVYLPQYPKSHLPLSNRTGNHELAKTSVEVVSRKALSWDRKCQWEKEKKKDILKTFKKKVLERGGRHHRVPGTMKPLVVF